MVKDVTGDHNRRSFLVRMAGVVIGTFSMPGSVLKAAASSTATATPTLDILMAPTWGGGARPFLLYTTADCVPMIWHAESSDRNAPDFLEMKRFYEAALNPGCPQVDPAEVFPIDRTREEKLLLRAIALQPDEEEGFLAYAKWLSDRGDELGNFIQAAVLSDQLTEDDPRRQSLDDRYGELREECLQRIFRPLAALGLWPTIGPRFFPALWATYGIVHSVEVNISGILPEQTDRLFQAAPALTSLKIGFEGWDIPKIVAQRQLSQIKKLSFNGGLDTQFTSDDLEALTRSKNLGRLVCLQVDHHSIARGVLHLADSSLLNRLEELDITGCDLDDKHAIALFSSGRTAKLQTLEIGGNDLTADALDAFAREDRWPALRELNLGSSNIGNEGLTHLLHSDLPCLRQLNLKSCDLDEQSVTALVASPLLAQLESLILDSNALGDAGVAALASSDAISNLKILELARVDCTAAGAQVVANCRHLSGLNELSLTYCDIGHEGALALARSPYLQELEKLTVDEESVGEQGKLELEQAFGENVSFY